MKIIITESQYRRLIEQEEPEVLHIPSLKYFNNDWNFLQKYLESEGNSPYTIGGDLNLRGTNIKSLGNLLSVGGYLSLYKTKIESLGNLQSVGNYLNLYGTNIESLGDLRSVGGGLNLHGTKIKSFGLIVLSIDLELTKLNVNKFDNMKQVRKNEMLTQSEPITVMELYIPLVKK
jgi:small nuclear ribonucleoprotein (snRNP)-like protein